MRRYFVLVAATAAAFSVIGCGDDSDGGSSNNGGGGGGSSVTQCVGNYDEFTATEFYAETTPDKGCSSQSDMASVCANNMPLIVGTCGKGCLNMGDEAQCVAECVQAELTDKKSAPLTEACLTCYGTDVACAKDNCLVACGLNPTSEACATCRAEKGCAEEFYACSGLPDPGT